MVQLYRYLLKTTNTTLSEQFELKIHRSRYGGDTPHTHTYAQALQEKVAGLNNNISICDFSMNYVVLHWYIQVPTIQNAIEDDYVGITIELEIYKILYLFVEIKIKY